jgi:hypothetical protein
MLSFKVPWHILLRRAYQAFAFWELANGMLVDNSLGIAWQGSLVDEMRSLEGRLAAASTVSTSTWYFTHEYCAVCSTWFDGKSMVPGSCTHSVSCGMIHETYSAVH